MHIFKHFVCDIVSPQEKTEFSLACQTGCNVSTQLIRTRPQNNNASEAGNNCQLGDGRGLRAGESVFIPENGTCRIVTCNV